MFLLLALPVAALAAFAVDDECREQSCALSALQRRARLTGGTEGTEGGTGGGALAHKSKGGVFFHSLDPSFLMETKPLIFPFEEKDRFTRDRRGLSEQIQASLSARKPCEMGSGWWT